MNRWLDLCPLIGRILIGGYFLWSGIEATLNFPAAVAQMAGTGLPAPLSVSLIFIAFEVLGGIALVIGFKVSQTALILAIYTLVTTLIYGNFANQVSQASFLEHVAIVGGLLILAGTKKSASR